MTILYDNLWTGVHIETVNDGFNEPYIRIRVNGSEPIILDTLSADFVLEDLKKALAALRKAI